MADAMKPEGGPPPPHMQVIADRICQFVFKESVSNSGLNLLRNKFSLRYPSVKPQVEYNINFDATTGKVSIKTTSKGYLLSSADQIELVTFQAKTFTVSGPPRMLEWSPFIDRTRADVVEFLELEPGVRCERMGLRSVYRFDVPNSSHRSFSPADYLTTVAPSNFDQTISQWLSRFELKTDKFTTIIMSAMAEPALAEHISFIVDLDVVIFQDFELSIDIYESYIGEMSKLSEDILMKALTPLSLTNFHHV